MTYTYKVTLEINRFDINNADIRELEIKTNEFSHTNPLVARNAAFTRSASNDEVLFDSTETTELLFQGLNNWRKELRKIVSFIDPNTNEEIILHDTIFVDEKTRTYDELMFRQILNSLKVESEILKKNGAHSSKNIEITFLPSNEIIRAEIIPTPFIQTDKINIQEISLD